MYGRNESWNNINGRTVDSKQWNRRLNVVVEGCCALDVCFKTGFLFGQCLMLVVVGYVSERNLRSKARVLMYNKKNKHYLQRPAPEETTRPLHVRVTNKNKRVNGFENDVINIHETTKKKGYYGRTASAWQTTFRLDRETSLLIIVLSNHPVSYLQFQFISLDGLGTGHLSKAVCFLFFFSDCNQIWGPKGKEPGNWQG